MYHRPHPAPLSGFSRARLLAVAALLSGVLLAGCAGPRARSPGSLLGKAHLAGELQGQRLLA